MVFLFLINIVLLIIFLLKIELRLFVLILELLVIFDIFCCIFNRIELFLFICGLIFNMIFIDCCEIEL